MSVTCVVIRLLALTLETYRDHEVKFETTVKSAKHFIRQVNNFTHTRT